VAYEDAATYASWAGKELPAEAQWEHAARGGLAGKPYAWGDELAPHGQRLANIWTGEFPWQKRDSDYDRTSPVKSYPANAYGLYDMIGNVWEWTTDGYTLPSSPPLRCCDGGALAGEGPERTLKVVKGGSFLCAPNYCRRYRPAARQPQSTDTSSSHIGFRCVLTC
jgi:formylglycine-generating enzyme